jgi:hypothetical protein
MKRSVLAALATAVAIRAFGLSLRYRRDMTAARARLPAVKRHVISTQRGAIEYAQRGYYFDPVLVLHGIFHNCVGGLLSVRELFPTVGSLLRLDSAISTRACRRTPPP